MFVIANGIANPTRVTLNFTYGAHDLEMGIQGCDLERKSKLFQSNSETSGRNSELY